MLRLKNPDLKTALLIYHQYTEISNSEIRELFGSKLSASTIVRLKNAAREQMSLDDKLAFKPGYVNTKSAYKAWGIDITEMEVGFKKLQKLGLMQT